MNLKQLITFGLENSQEPVIKNPILRAALEEPRTMDQASLSDDLEPGALKDEMKGNFDPSQETHEEYLQRINLERPFNAAHGGSPGQLVAPSGDGLRPGYGGKNQHSDMTEKVNKFLKGKKEIKDSVLRKKLEDIGYKNPIQQVNSISSKTGIKIIRDVPTKVYISRGFPTLDLKELQKATKGLFEEFDLSSNDFNKLTNAERNLVSNRIRNLPNQKWKTGRDFEPLPKETIKDIKAKYSNSVSEWNFDKYRYGVQKKGNTRIYDQIRTFVDEPKPFKYAVNLSSPEGWMIAQYDRAAVGSVEGAELYKPIYRMINNNKRIVGFIDNSEAGGGKKYFAADKWIKGKDADGLLLQKAHPDFNNTKKFYDIASKAHESPSKVITDILKKGGVDVTDKRLKLNHLLNYLIDEKGVDKLKRAMVIHHRGGVLGNPTQDYQILNKVINNKIKGVEDAMRAGNITKENIGKLKKWGASVTIDGKTYGSGPKTAMGGLREIEKFILKGSKEVDLYGREIRGMEQWKKQDFNKFKTYLKKLGCGMYAGGRVGFKVGSGTCMNRAVAKLKSGNLSSAEKKIVDAMGDGLKKSGMPKKFWTTALKGEGYFALADFANNLTKGQSLDKSFSNAVKTATFGALDIGGNERDLMKYAEERGLDTKDMKEWMNYAQTYGKYAKAHEDQQYAHETLVSDEIVGPDDTMLQQSVLDQSPDRIKKLEDKLGKQYESKGKSIESGYKDLNEAIEGVVAKEWNKTAGTPFDRGFRKMVGMKGDEGLVWGGIGSMFREGMEKSGFGEHDALKGFKPQTVLNYHPVHGYKEGIKSLIREGDSPMEDMLEFMKENYPDDRLLQEALRENAKIEEKEDWEQTGWGLKKRNKKVDMGIYDN